MAKQRHDIGWQKAHREGVRRAGEAAAAARRARKAERAAELFAREHAAYLAAQAIEGAAIRARTGTPAEQPPAPPTVAPTVAPAAPAPGVKPCARCGKLFAVKGGKRYCSGACRLAARPVAPPVQGSPRDRPHRTLRGAK